MIHIVVNPIAGNGRTKAALPEIERALSDLGLTYALHYTEYVRHAVELIRALIAEGAERIIAVGGDGTIREAAQACAGTSAILGLIPAGTGNDFAKLFQMPESIYEMARIAATAEPQAIDTATSATTSFANIASVGFDAHVVKATERYKKRFKGFAAYFMGLLHSLFHLEYETVELSLDGGAPEQLRVLMVIVANGQYYGGGFRCMPIADPSDGILNVLIVKDLKRRKIFRLLPLFIKGKHLGNPNVRLATCKTVSLAMPEPDRLLNVDGELLPFTPQTFSVQPGSLRLAAPPFIGVIDHPNA